MQLCPCFPVFPNLAGVTVAQEVSFPALRSPGSQWERWEESSCCGQSLSLSHDPTLGSSLGRDCFCLALGEQAEMK